MEISERCVVARSTRVFKDGQAQQFEGHTYMSLDKRIEHCCASLPLHLSIEACLLSGSGIS